MNKLYMALGCQFLAGILAFFQLQGWVVWDKPWLKSMWRENIGRPSYKLGVSDWIYIKGMGWKYKK